MSPIPFCVCGQQPSLLPSSLLRSSPPSFLLVFLFAGKVRGSESECVSATVIIAIVSPSLPLSLSPLSHCPPLPFSGIRGTNVIHSPARRRRSRSLRPNGQLCKSPVPPPRHPPVDYKHTSLPPPPRTICFRLRRFARKGGAGTAFRQSRNAMFRQQWVRISSSFAQMNNPQISLTLLSVRCPC